MNDYYTVGIATTIGWAHPNTGDTVCTIQIGGLRTVVNGDFEINAGDEVQWYWTFEKDCFCKDGSRKPITDNHYHDPEIVLDDVHLSPEERTQANNKINHQGNAAGRRRFNDYQYGMDKGPGKKSDVVIRLKPYIEDEDHPRPNDKRRVMGIAISSARPGDLVDIKIQRQAM